MHVHTILFLYYYVSCILYYYNIILKWHILSMSYADAAHIVLNMHAKVARKSCDL